MGTRRGGADANARRLAPLAVAATAVEWYDFAVYGAMATVLADVFFPDASGTAQAVAVFALFATSFVARPVGALVLGARADRRGSGPIFAHLVLLMAAATGTIGLLPSTTAVGAVAPFLLLVLRLLQGFSAGGQPASALLTMVDAAPPGARGRFAGWHMTGVLTGLGTGIAVAAVVIAVVPADVLAAWAWRLPFLLAFPLGVVGWLLQRRVHASPRPTSHRNLARSLLASHRPTIRRGFWLMALLSCVFNTWFVFLPNHVAGPGLPLRQALGAAVLGIAVAAAITPSTGRLADAVGRRPLVLVASAGLTVAALPAYALATSGVVALLLLADVVVAILLAVLVVPVLLAESFVAGTRATGLGLTYGLGSAVFGGTAPLVATVLSRAGEWLVPAYLVVLGLVATRCAVGLRETVVLPYAPALPERT